MYKTRIKTIWLVLVLIGIRLPGWTQEQDKFSFPAEASGFMTETTRFFSDTPGKKSKEIILQLEKFIADYQPEENEWISIAAVANTMLLVDSKPLAQFNAFINSLTSFSNSNLSRYSLTIWLNEIRDVLNRPYPSFTQADALFSFAYQLNTKRELYHSESVIWKLDGNSWELMKDTSLYLNFSNCSLTGLAGKEHSVIDQLSGRYYPYNKQLSGNTGRINWETVSINADKVYADLNNFAIDLARSVYSIDSVLLTDKRYFNHPVIGRLENKIATGMPSGRRGYPIFSSYNRINQIKSIFPNMDYTGGFTLKGSKVIGADIYNKKGTLLIYQNNKPFMRLASTYFLFTPIRARGVNTELSIYLDTDSIFHPGLSFQYQQKLNELALMRDGRGLSNSRFIDTYHKLDMDVEMMIWHPGDSIIMLSGMVGSLENHANFESADYFSIERFNEIQVADWINPLVGIKNCSDYYHSRFFTSADLSEYLKRPRHLIEEMLLNVSFLGFVRFDSQTGMVEVNQRCFDFIAKHAEKQDYDIIRFQSEITPPTPNGYLNILSGRLKLYGVKTITFSTAQSVIAFPTANQVLVDKNRRIMFDGYVQAGLLKFTGRNFTFEYKPFRIKMDQIDFINIKVHIPVNEDYSETIIKDISSVIENTRGSLFIDNPHDKSGIKKEEFPNFPMFIADTSAYIYYDQDFIQHGAYVRDSFYFSTNELKIKGLHNVYLKDSLSFPGQFRTAGIFPLIDVNLQYRDDNSLGFSTLVTPDSGYAVYNGKGRFYNEIEMSNNGLLGNGVLEYLDATLVSDAFLFLPDELRTSAKDINIAASVDSTGNPETKGKDIDITWHPAENKMNAIPKDSLLSIYGNVKFDGEMTIEPDGVKGKGKLSIDNYSIASDRFSFYTQSLSADKGKLTIFSQFQNDSLDNQAPNPDLITENTKIHIDFDKKIAKVSPESSGSYIRFPENQFRSVQSGLSWIIGDSIVNITPAEWLSENKAQQGLSFNGKEGSFNRLDYSILVNRVDSIRVADIIVYPGNKRTVIRPGALIDSLPDCRIKALDPTIEHTLVNAIVYITGKNKYHATGDYVYTDKAGRKFLIPFNNISAGNDISSGAGHLDIGNAFFLSPEYAYKGDVNMQMNEKLLSFDGSFQLSYPCTSSSGRWVKMHTTIDPDNVIIPIDSIPLDENNERLHAGFLLSNQPIKLYSSFLGPHLRYSDQALIESSGQLIFDYSSSDYRIATADKLQSPEKLLPEMRLDRDNCQLSGEGPLNLGIDLGQVKITSSGIAKQDLKNDSIRISTVLGLDFYMNDKAMQYMARSLNNHSNARAINYSDTQLRRSLMYYLGRENGKKVLSQLGLMGGFRKLPDEMEHSILFSQLNLSWDEARGSYVSNGLIGISNIQNKPVNKLFKGKVEIVHRRGGDTFTMYIETDPQSYFFFTYSRGLMQVVAGPGYEKFNNYVRKTKESKRKMKVNKTGVPYQYYIGQYRLVRNFLDQFHNE